MMNDAPIQGFTPMIQVLDNPEKIKTITVHANVEDWYDAAANNFDTTVVVRDFCLQGLLMVAHTL